MSDFDEPEMPIDAVDQLRAMKKDAIAGHTVIAPRCLRDMGGTGMPAEEDAAFV